MKKSILLAVAAALTLAACNKDEEIVNNGSEEEGMTYTADDLKPGDYFYRTESGEWAFSDGGLRRVYPDGTMEWAAKTKSQRDDSKGICIGIVFAVGQSVYDKSDYSATGINQKQCHGYVVALQDATDGYCMWGKYGVELGCCPKNDDGKAKDNWKNPDIDWSGYDYTRKIITQAGGEESLNADKQNGYPATYYAVVNYENSVAAPTNSSGWFLPSIGQLWQIYQLHNNLANTDAGGCGLTSWDYWSSSECYDYPSYYALSIAVWNGGVRRWDKCDNWSIVRAVLAF